MEPPRWSLSAPLLIAFVVGVVGFNLASGETRKEKPEIYSLHITSDIKYRFATTLVTSRVKNAAAVSREAIFDVTLPNEAFITNFTLEIDGKIVVGEVKEKEEAAEQYATAVARGETAGFIGTRPRETNKFNLKVTVAPQSKVNFNLTYQELLKRQRGHYEQVIYIDPGQPVRDMSVAVAILESREITDLIVPPLRNDGTDVDITETNPLAVIQRPSAHSAIVKYFPNIEEQTKKSLQGISAQFVVKYDVEREMDGGDILVVNGYFVHFFAPEGFDPIPKDVLFVLDKSGSMMGTKLAQLKTAMNSILNDLQEHDRLNIMTFSGTTSFWQYEMITADEESIDDAKKHVNLIKAGGWTNIDDALSKAIEFLASQQDKEQHRSPVIVFLTDGEATSGETDSEAILKNIRQKNEGNIPIFSLAFGRYADYELAKKISAQNDGFGRKIYDASDAALQISGFYDEIAVTLLNNITFNYLDAPVANMTKHRYRNYFKGSEVVVCGRFAEQTSMADDVVRMEVISNSVEGPIVLEVDNELLGLDSGAMNMTETGDYETITEKIWAYLTIKQLLEKGLAATDPEEKEGYNRQVLELSLRYGFVTPLTAMVVTQLQDEEDDIIPILDEEFADSDDQINLHSQRSRQHHPALHARLPPRTGSVGRKMSPGWSAPGRAKGTFAQQQSGLASSRFDAPPPVQHSMDLDADSSPRRSKARKSKNKRRKDKRKDNSGKKRKRKPKKKTTKPAIDYPLRVQMAAGVSDPFCVSMLDKTNLAKPGSYLMYKDTVNDQTVTVDLTVPGRSKDAKLRTATIGAVTITTGETRLTIRHHLVEGEANCTSNRPWALHWVLQCDGVGVESQSGYLIVTLGNFTMYVQKRSTADSTDLHVFVDGTKVHGPGDQGLIGDLLSSTAELRKIKTKRGKSIGHFLVGGTTRVTSLKRPLPPQTVTSSGSFCWLLWTKGKWLMPMTDYRYTDE